MKNKTIIIAEAGVNHNGNIDIAKKLIDVAAKAKVDYVKFQTFKADTIVNKNAKKAIYQINNSKINQSQYEMLKKLELNNDDHIKLIEYCNVKKIKFLSTAFDNEGLDYLNSKDFSFYKIPSGEITNLLYLKKLASFGRPVLLSTGMSNMDEIEAAINILTKQKLTLNDITILHCNTEYPTPMRDVNLKAMISIQNKFNVKVGYSDHTLGIEVPIAAVALGACVIEKHFTLDRNLEGPDHLSSLEPKELIKMVESIRNIENAIAGSGIKAPSKSELKNINVVRKSIHLKSNLKKGEIIKESDLIILRPNNGISPMEWNNVIEKKINQDMFKGDCLNWNNIQ